MDRHVATSHDEVLGAGLAKLTSLCTVSGTPKANADGVALVGVVIASLFAPPPGVATHSVEADGGLADFPNPKGPGGSMDPSRARPVAEAVVVQPAGEASDGASDGGAGEGREYMSDDGVAEAAAAGAAPVPGAALVDAEMSDAPTLLGSILGDETASLALAEAWGAYPPDLRGPFANDLYGRLADDFDGAEDPLEAAMAFLCVLTRDVGVAFDATDFWAAAKRFVREERKRAADKLPVWLPALLTHLAAAVREFAGRAPKQSEAVTRKIVNAALPAWAKVRRSEVADVEVAIRPAYPTGASVKVRAVLVAATWALSTLQRVARSVVERPGEGIAAPSVMAFPGVAAEFGVSADTLARCLGMVPVEADGVALTVAAAPDPTKDHLLAPDPAFKGWAHPSRGEHTRRGGAWKGANLIARRIAAATYAYPFSNKEGTTSETCLVMAHGEKAQGDGTLCHGCMARAGCTERYAYTRGGFALKQGHVAACQTQVLAQLKCTFPGGVFDPKLCVGLKEGVHAIPCSLTPNGAEGGGMRIKDPAEWAAAMRAARCPYESHTSAGPRAQPYAVDRAVAHNRAIPVCADDFDWPGVSLPIHPQDDHESWFYYRWEAGGPANVPIQALKVTADMAMHESWTPSWYATDRGKAYLALSRDEKRAELLKAMASRPATRAGKKRRTAKKRVPSESEADSADDPFSGAGYQMKVAKVEVEHITLVADGTTLSGRIAERLGAPGYAQVHGVDRSRALPVLLQEGMNERPLLVWTFPYAEYALSSFHRLVRGRVLPQTPFNGLDLTLGVASATLGGYVVRGDSVVGALLEWLAPYVGSKVGTDLADLTLFIRSYSERSDHRVAGRMYPTQVAPRQCWHITPQPAGLGGELPAGLLAAVEARVRELDVTAGSREEWAAYLHRRMQVMFAMPPERWAYTLLHLAEYNGGRLPGLVDPGLSTREAGTSAPHDHEYGVVQEVLLHSMYWVMSRARIEVPVEEDGEMWEPPEDERTGPAAPLRRTALGGSRLRDLTELAAFLAAFRSLEGTQTGASDGGEAAETPGVAEEAEEQSSEDGAADDLLGMDEVPAIAQMAWADFTGSGSLMTMGLCTLCFIHAVIEVRIAANPTKDPLAPSTRLAGTCPAIRESGVAEAHTLLFDVAITYTGRCEVRGGEDAPRASLKCLAEAFGLIDDEGEEIPEDKLERLFERVRLIAAVPYLEALEDLLRERLVAVTTAVGIDGFVSHDQYAFYRPVESWQRINLPSQYACKRGTKRSVSGLSRCMLGTVSTGAGSVDPRGAHRLLASLLAALDLTPAPTEKPEPSRPWNWAVAGGPVSLGQRGTQPDLGCPEAPEVTTWLREDDAPERTKLASYFFGRLATMVATAEAAVALTTLEDGEYNELFEKYTKGKSADNKLTRGTYPPEGGRPVYGPAYPDYDHPHLCLGTVERLWLWDEGAEPSPDAAFGPRMAESARLRGGYHAVRGLMYVPLVGGKTGGVRNASQLALSLMGAARDTPYRGLAVQEGVGVLMRAPVAEFATDLPQVSRGCACARCSTGTSPSPLFASFRRSTTCARMPAWWRARRGSSSSFSGTR